MAKIMKKALDNDKTAIKKAYDENYGILLAWGGMYRFNLATFIFITSGTVHVIFFSYTAYLKMDELETVSEAIHFVVLLSAAIMSTINSIYYSRLLSNLFKAIGSGFYDYEGTLSKECQEKIDTLVEISLKVKKFYGRLFVVMVVFVGTVIAITRPVVEFSKQHPENVPDEEYDHVNRYLAVSIWYPWDSRKPFYFVLSYIAEYSIVAITPGVVLGTDVTFLCISEELLVQLKAICISLQNCKERALRLCSLNGEKTGFEHDPKFRRCLNMCLGHSVRHHQCLLELFKDFKTYNFYFLLAIMISSTYMICLSFFIFTSDDVSINSKMTFFLFLSAELVHTFLFCWYGEQIKTQSEKIGYSIYESDWVKNHEVIKHYALVMQARALFPMRLSAGGFMDASLNTFTNVLRNSYSYFNLLIAVRK